MNLAYSVKNKQYLNREILSSLHTEITMYLQYLQFSKILDFLHCFTGIHILQAEKKLHNSSEHKQLLNRDRLLILTY